MTIFPMVHDSFISADKWNVCSSLVNDIDSLPSSISWTLMPAKVGSICMAHFVCVI